MWFYIFVTTAILSFMAMILGGIYMFTDIYCAYRNKINPLNEKLKLLIKKGG